MADEVWKNSPNLLESCYPGVFRVADHESEDSFKKFHISQVTIEEEQSKGK